MPISHQVVWLFLLAIPIACISWTVTHEEVFREPREFCVRKSEGDPSLLCRKFYYLFTCEYCFSHYVTLVFLVITRYRLLYDDWRGYLISFFSLVFVANFYIGAFGKVKLGVKKDRVEIEAIQDKVKATGKPRIRSSTTSRTAQFGISKNGKSCVAIWISSHATTA